MNGISLRYRIDSIWDPRQKHLFVSYLTGATTQTAEMTDQSCGGLHKPSPLDWNGLLGVRCDIEYVCSLKGSMLYITASFSYVEDVCSLKRFTVVYNGVLCVC